MQSDRVGNVVEFIFSNLIAVVENAAYLFMIYHPKFTEFSTFYEKLPCMHACSV